MPRRKKTNKKIQHKTIDKQTEDFLPLRSLPVHEAHSGRGHQIKLFFIGILVVGMVALFLTNKGLLIAAVVDGKPIFRWELTKSLLSRFGAQTLEGMITERLIATAAQKEGITITTEEITTKEQDIVKSLGPNIGVEELLKYQGMTKEDFDKQIRLQLTVAKVLGKDLAITEGDIDNFIATNRALLAATQEGELRKEAQQAILDQHIGGKVQEWLYNLRQSAKILTFL